MSRLNRTDRYHLCYLFVHNINEDIFDGLSHVLEHSLLIPTDIGLDFDGYGYTCANHVWLYFGSEKLETIIEVDRQIMNCEIITDENVNRAKRQVEEEILRLRELTIQNRKMINFVTEQRIKSFAIGDLHQIKQINRDDITRWFENRKYQNQVFRFIFKDANNMIVSTPLNDLKREGDNISCKPGISGGEDSFMLLNKCSGVCTIQLFLKLPTFVLKEKLIEKAIFEFCIQKKIEEEFGIVIEIYDKFFDNKERFAMLAFKWNAPTDYLDVIKNIRLAINRISLDDFLRYKDEFKQYSNIWMSPNESNTEIMNGIKNFILYGTPKIQREDLTYIDQINYSMFPRDFITKSPLKVIIS